VRKYVRLNIIQNLMRNTEIYRGIH